MSTSRARDGRTTPVRPAASRRAVVVHLVCVALALILWLVSLPWVDPAQISGWGLLSAVPFTWWIALGLAVMGQTTGVLGRQLNAPLFWAYQVVVVAVIFATTSAVYEYPRYPWTYKHVGVVEQLLESRFLETLSLDRSIDIYHNWPGFFVLAAGVSTLLQVTPLTVAQWAEPVFALAAAGALAYAVRAVTADRARIWLTVVLYTLATWIGTNYYSPQALAMVLALLLLGIALRVMPVRDAEGRLTPRRLTAWLTRGRTIEALAPPSALVVRRPVLLWIAATALWTMLVVSHQLTPVGVALQLGVLWCLVKIRPLWLLALWALIEIAWVAAARQYLTDQTSLFQRDALSRISWPGVELRPSLPGMSIVGLCGPLIEAAVPMVGLAAAVWFFWRGRRLHLVPLALALAPPLLLAVQTYGGEAVFRVYLYGLAWWALLVSTLLVSLWDRGGLRRVVTVAALAVLTLLSAAANFSQELVSYVPVDDVAVSRWYEANTPNGSQAITITGNGFPLLMTADYPGHINTRPPLDDFLASPPLAYGPEAALDQVLNNLYAGGHSTGYVVMDNQQRTWARMYATATPEELATFVTTLRRSTQWQVVYDERGAIIAKYRG